MRQSVWRYRHTVPASALRRKQRIVPPRLPRNGYRVRPPLQTPQQGVGDRSPRTSKSLSRSRAITVSPAPMLPEETTDNLSPFSLRCALVSLLGILLLAGGTAAGLYVFFAVLSVVHEGSEPALVRHLVEVAAERPADVTVTDQTIRFSEGIVQLVAYPVVALLYMVAAGIALGLLRSGISLLQPELGKAVRDLVSRLDALTQQRRGR